MEITALRSIHALDAARLHIAGQPGTFLTSLGPEVLTVFYRALPQSPTGFGFAVQDTGDEEYRQPIGGHRQSTLANSYSIAGFVAATTCTGCLFIELGTRHLLHFFPPLLLRYSQHPRLLWRSIETLFYPFAPSRHVAQSHRAGRVTDQGEPAAVAELLSIMVEPTRRSQGLGAQLVAQLVAACQARHIGALDVTVDAGNAGARRFYAQQGFVEEQTFPLYGRAMARYRLQLLPLKA